MIPLPDKKYSIIYADPPWSYQNRGTRAAASKHYDTMTIEDIKRTEGDQDLRDRRPDLRRRIPHPHTAPRRPPRLHQRQRPR